jgi:hypothetical protein
MAFGLALAACSSFSDPYKEPEPNIYPKNYKQEIIDTLSTDLTDPTNIRDAYITDPALSPVNKDQRYTVCVRANVRDQNRSYTGSKDRIAYFFGGHLNQLIEATAEQCGNAAYKPFPELEKLCLAKKCQ